MCVIWSHEERIPLGYIGDKAKVWEKKFKFKILVVWQIEMKNIAIKWIYGHKVVLNKG